MDTTGYATRRKLLTYLLRDIGRFSTNVIGVPLYGYQLEPLYLIIDSVLRGHGREYLLVFPRQSGKNEAVAQLLVYLLTVYQRRGGQMVFGAIGDGLGRGRRRLQERLDNPLLRGLWRREGHPARIVLGQAAVSFISSHPQAASRGETAEHLLIIDEAQEQDGPHIEAVFTPMRAAHNATAVYLGTVRSTHDYLWQKKEELSALTAADGVPRVFLVTPEQVCRENADYARFLAAQVARYGRHHPIIASEYYLEPINSGGRLFPGWRLALMHGRHPRRTAPRADGVYIATIDVAGQDEQAGTGRSLDNPGRDYTIATVFEVIESDDGRQYQAVDVLVDQGSRHFQANAGQSRLADRLLAYVRHWQVAHTVVDASGVGQGLADWLSAALGANHVTSFLFSGQSVKARLGSDFLALVDTGRFQYWTGDEETPLSDGWWFWQQAAACTFTVGSGGRFDRDLRWGVPTRATIETPAGSQRIHDDRLLSAALVAEAERRAQSGSWHAGQAVSHIVPRRDPLWRH
jgi:hypothetical protein